MKTCLVELKINVPKQLSHHEVVSFLWTVKIRCFTINSLFIENTHLKKVEQRYFLHYFFVVSLK